MRPSARTTGFQPVSDDENRLFFFDPSHNERMMSTPPCGFSIAYNNSRVPGIGAMTCMFRSSCLPTSFAELVGKPHDGSIRRVSLQYLSGRAFHEAKPQCCAAPDKAHPGDGGLCDMPELLWGAPLPGPPRIGVIYERRNSGDDIVVSASYRVLERSGARIVSARRIAACNGLCLRAQKKAPPQKAEKKEHARRHQYVPYDFRCCKHMPRLFTAPLGTVLPRKSLLQRKRKYSTFRWIALANLPRGSAKALYVRVRSTSLH